MLHAARTALHVLVGIWALFVILNPEARQAGWFLFVPLYLVLAGDLFVREWRSGHLHKTLAEIARNPPRTSALEFLAIVLGSVAVTMALSSL